MNEQDLEKGLMACVHCGFCLDACPTYRETGDEADSPRGRIVLMRGVFEGKIPLLSEDATAPGTATYHLDRCLGCRGCETACPSGVPYGNLLEHFRNEQEKVLKRPPGERVLREGLLTLLTDPAKMSLALKAGKLIGGRIPAPVARFVGLPTDTAMPIPKNLSEAARPVPERTPAIGLQRGRVALLSGCVMRVLYSPVHHATVRVLAANGIEVICPEKQGCCGALHGHQGKLDEARELARNMIAFFETGDFDAILLNSAGCGSFLKDYRHLLKDDPEWAERATAFANRIRDITEYLVEIGPRPMRSVLPVRITYHDACHLAHGQRITKPPRALLRSIPGVTYTEAVDADQCCGSAGVYNYLQPSMARALLHKKLENLLAAEPDYIATGNPGCLAWIEQGIKAGLGPRGAKMPKVVHPVELLDMGYTPPGGK
ncbi:MAG: heterodisulfide reductase-related iron-sulfur binding cluster [Capsulimonadales bacterium]|nr:heterodisulfide reductase-related iron-sulfur binding cluster [Capsulimonadales bacterium]